MKKRSNKRRTPRILPWLPATALLGTAAVGAVAASFARKVVVPSARPDAGASVEVIEPSASSPTGQRVWLRGEDVDLVGSYSFIFDATSRLTQQDAGHARLGPVIETVKAPHGDLVARDVISVERGDLYVGARGRLTGWWFTDPAQLGFDVRVVSLPLPDGVGWGWVIEPKESANDAWAIHVHGRGALPVETLRGVTPFAEAGIRSLVIAYRNDFGAPPAKGGRYGLGLSESLDVDAALGWVRQQGARSVTLVGWSMGATACVLAAANGANAELVDSMVLDSPALDWKALLRHQAKLGGAPSFIADLGMLLLKKGLIEGSMPGERGTDLDALTSSKLTSTIRVPTLIHASAGDTFVPWQGSLRAAQHRSSLVRLHAGSGEHVKLWNVDPATWEAETSHFIEMVEQTRAAIRD